MPTEFRLRIRNRENTADALVISSMRGDAAPYLEGAPVGEGYQFDPLTGRSRAGTMRVRVIDAVSGYDGTTPLRILTQQLEDETARWALPARIAILEKRTDGVTWDSFHPGSITQHLLQGGLVWDLAITDIALAMRKTLAFAPRKHSDPDLAAAGVLEPIADYLARWPRRGCLIGGPVRGGLLNAPDIGGWRMTVEQRRDYVHTNTWLKFQEGYGSPKFTWTKKPQELWAAIDRDAGRAQVVTYSVLSELTTVDQVRIQPFPGLVVEVIRGATTQYFRPSWRGGGWDGIQDELFNAGKRNPGLFIADYDEVLPLGAACRVRVFDLLPGERSPLYVTGHPIDIAAALLDETDEVYDAASVETVRAAIGASRRLTLRITETPDRQGFLESVLYGPFGIGVRPRSAGGVEFFATRIFANSAPLVELTAASIPRADGGGFSGTTFDVDTTTAISQVVVEVDRLSPVQLLPEDTREQYSDTPSDGVRVDEGVRIERTNGDPGAIAGDTVEFTIPGMTHLADSATGDSDTYFDAFAREVFDRWGRGIQASEHEVRDDDEVAEQPLGAEIINVLEQFPNHNRRLGDDPTVAGRAQQIVQRTVLPRGVHVRLLDSGPNAQPVPTLPVLAIAASSEHPRTIAEVTITNAATLNAAGYGVQLVMAAPAAAPASDDYTVVRAFPAGQVPTAGIPLPAVLAGRTVYVRGRSTHPELRPSNLSAAASVALTAIAAVAGLTATPDPADGARATLAWALPDAEPFVLDVTFRLSSETAADARRLPVLPAGSTGAGLEELTIGAEYVVAVTRRDPETGDTSAEATVTFVAGAAAAALEPPMIPTGFTGYGGLRCGLAVLATEFPSFIAFRVRTETAEGSGVYGDYEDLGREEAIAHNWTAAAVVTPYDRRRRAFSARTEVDGLTPSEWTAEVIVEPWVTTPLGPLPQHLDAVYGLSNFRVERISATEAEAQWSRGAQVVWVFVYQWTLPTGSAFPTPTEDDLPAILAVGADAATLVAPRGGQRTFYQVECRDAEFRLLSDVVRDFLDPVPLPARWRTSAEEPTEGTGRVTVELEDAGGFVDPATRVRFRRTLLGTTTDHAAATAPAGAATTGTYTFDVALDAKHPVLVEAYATYVDGSLDTIGSWTFDRNKAANIANLTAVVEGNSARVVADFDTDVAIGAGMARYAIDAESGWTTFDTDANRRAAVAIALTAARQVIYVQGQNAAGSWGPSARVELPAYGIQLEVDLELTATHGIITWGGVNVEVKVDGGAWGPPPPDDDGVVSGNQITVARNAAGGAYKHYAFRSVVNGQTLQPPPVVIPPQEGASPSTAIILRVLGFEIYSEASDQLEGFKTASGPFDHYHWYWREAGTLDLYTEVAADSDILTVGPPFNVDSGGGGTRTIEAYLEAHDDSDNVLAVSNERTYSFPAGADY